MQISYFSFFLPQGSISCVLVAWVLVGVGSFQSYTLDIAQLFSPFSDSPYILLILKYIRPPRGFVVGDDITKAQLMRHVVDLVLERDIAHLKGSEPARATAFGKYISDFLSMGWQRL